MVKPLKPLTVFQAAHRATRRGQRVIRTREMERKRSQSYFLFFSIPTQFSCMRWSSIVIFSSALVQQREGITFRETIWRSFLLRRHHHCRSNSSRHCPCLLCLSVSLSVPAAVYGGGDILVLRCSVVRPAVGKGRGCGRHLVGVSGPFCM